MNFRRAPLLLIGGSAGVAVWSGWVGLGELTGFGIVKPFPGISDLEINTAITLPIGMEAYAVMALGYATTEKDIPTKARRFAWISAVGALILGVIGQVSYHMIAASGQYPFLTIFVSSLPVLVVGMASALWHLTSGHGTTSETSGAPDSSDIPDVDPEPVRAVVVRPRVVSAATSPRTERVAVTAIASRDDLEIAREIIRDMAGGDPFAMRRDPLAEEMRVRVGGCSNAKASTLLKTLRGEADG